MANKSYKYPIEFNEKIPYYNKFIERYADSNNKQIRNRLISFTLYIEKAFSFFKRFRERAKTILETNIEECLEFFQILDNRDITRVAKIKWRSNLNAYFEFVKEIKEKIEKTPFINPVPSFNLYDFKEKEITIDDMEKEEDLMTYQIAEKILNYIYFVRRRLFIATAILLYTGARISEVCRIELNNLDLEERYFITKIKSKKSLNRVGIYFLPKFFIPYLRKWIRTIKIEHPNTKYLFPSKETSITTHTIRKNLRKVKNEKGLDCQMNPHAFRDLINSERFDTKMKKKYRFLLLNQTPPNVNVKNYLKKYKLRKELQKKYDEFFPFPEFKPKLNLI